MKKDAARSIILARRARFLAVAAATIAVTSTSTARADDAGDDASTSSSDASTQSDGSTPDPIPVEAGTRPPSPDASQEPQVCLTMKYDPDRDDHRDDGCDCSTPGSASSPPIGSAIVAVGLAATALRRKKKKR